MRLSRVPGQLLRPRLDGAYYHPSALALDAQLRSFGNARSLESLCDPRRPITNGVRGPDFMGSSFRLIRLQDCIDWEVRADLSLSISARQFDANARCRLQRDDVVVAIGGHVGNAAIVIDDAAAVIGQHSARVSVAVDGPMRPRFLVAYLNSEPGRIQFARLMRGTVQQGLNLEDVEEIEVPVFADLAQRYVGDKVRQAERLRERARRTSRASRELVDALIEQRVSGADLVDAQQNSEPIASVAHRSRREDPPGSALGATVASRRFSRITFSTMTSDRMDASYYAPRFLENERRLASCGTPMAPIASLTDKCNCGSTPVDVTYDGHGVGLIRTTDVRPNAFLGHDVLRTSGLRISSDSSVAAVADDLVYTMSGTIGYAAVVPPTDEVFSFSNTIVRARFSERSGQDPWFTAAFFNSTYGYTQSLRLVSGGMQGHVMPNPFKKLLVPTPDTRAQKFIGKHLRHADECTRQARSLVAAAKLLVEQLIDGRVTEGELVAAQKALEAGDRSADREILKGLRLSDAPAAKPLIPDVDALYALLDESQQTEDAGL